MITETSFPGYAVVNDTVAMTCSATGIPVPTITWERGNSIITETLGMTVSTKSLEGNAKASSSLTILGIQLTDAGSYSCHADNSLALELTSSETTHLFVYGWYNKIC